MKTLIGLIVICLFFPTLSEAKTFSTTFTSNNPFFSGYQNVFAKKTDGVGFVVTWAVYHAVSWILDELFPPYEDPGTFLLKTYEKIQSISQSLSSYGR